MWLYTCVAIFSLFVCGFLVKKLFYQYWRANGEPILFSGYPFLGHAISFGQDYFSLLQRLIKNAGPDEPAITVYVAGMRMHFITSPLDYPSILRDSKRLTFSPVSFDVMKGAFLYEMTGEEKEFEKWKHAKPALHALMRGQPLRELLGTLRCQLDEALSDAEALFPAPDADGWCGIPDLYELTKEIIWQTTARVLYGDVLGDSRDSLSQSLTHFDNHDKHFPLMVAGVPAKYLSGATDAIKYMRTCFKKPSSSFPSLLMNGRQKFLEENFRDQDKAATQHGFSWGVFANTMPAAFWALFFAARDPSMADRCRGEALKSFKSSSDIDQKEVTPDPSSEIMLPTIQAAISEAFRLSIASLTVRCATENMDISLHGTNKILRVRKGDRVVLAPALVHMDPEIYPEPLTYMPDRFLKKKVREKGGHAIAASIALQPFGGGVSMCPGRHLAQAELRGFVAKVFMRWEVDLSTDGVPCPTPPLDMARAGLGVLPPIRATPCRIRIR